MSDISHIFLGALCAEGFCSHYGELLQPNAPFTVYIVKGSSGSGKSTFFKKTARALSELGYPVTLIHCSFDPDSLDGVVCKSLRLALVDGTAPHTLDPVLTGTKHRVISFYEFADCEKLEVYAGEIETLLKRKGACMKRAQGLISPAASLYEQLYSTAGECLLSQKAADSFDRLARRLIPRGGTAPRCAGVFASALTPQGCKTALQLGRAENTTLYIINDANMCAASAGLTAVLNCALQRGQSAEVGRNPLCRSAVEYVALPELSLIFCANSFAADFCADNAKTINAARFYDQNALKARKNRIALYKQLISQMTAQAVAQLAQAKQLHNEIERRYSSCMDFKAQNKLCEQYIKSFTRL